MAQCQAGACNKKATKTLQGIKFCKEHAEFYKYDFPEKPKK